MTNTTSQAPSTAAFDFVRTLAAELSVGNVDLPSFPEIAVRVRRVLSDPKSSVEQVVRVVGSEPALAARLLRIANSASLNRSGRAVTDLRTAINRIGYNMVRSASISFSMAQIRTSNKLAGLEHHLNDLWQRSTSVAAFAYVLARTCTKVNPDEAMLTGMMHGIGKLYVLTRVIDHPELFASNTMLNQIIGEWHASIGKAILENWKFPESMAQAVGDQADFSRTSGGDARIRRRGQCTQSGPRGLSEMFGGDALGDIIRVVGHDAGEIHAAVRQHINMVLLAQALHRFGRNAQ